MAALPLTKKQKAELRRLADLAHERELSAAMDELEAEFRRWRSGHISVFELNERIHKFHHGISRELYKRYDPRDAEMVVPGAIARGTIREDEVDVTLLHNLSDLIQFVKSRQRDGTKT
jgi:hypothetical protein